MLSATRARADHVMTSEMDMWVNNFPLMFSTPMRLIPRASRAMSQPWASARKRRTGSPEDCGYTANWPERSQQIRCCSRPECHLCHSCS